MLQGQPSPTTGTFPGPPFMDQSPISVLTSETAKGELIEAINASSLLAFKHQSDSTNTTSAQLGNQVCLQFNCCCDSLVHLNEVNTSHKQRSITGALQSWSYLYEQ